MTNVALVLLVMAAIGLASSLVVKYLRREISDLAVKYEYLAKRVDLSRTEAAAHRNDVSDEIAELRKGLEALKKADSSKELPELKDKK